MNYPKALYHLALEKNSLQPWLELLESIHKMLLKHPKIDEYFSSPLPLVEEKKRLFNKHFARLPRELGLFLNRLLEKGRFGMFHQIVQNFKTLAYGTLGLLEGRIVTATPLEAKTREELIQKLENNFSKKIELNEEVDPSLIGGGILTIQDQRIDFSLKGKLNRLKQDLKER